MVDKFGYNKKYYCFGQCEVVCATNEGHRGQFFIQFQERHSNFMTANNVCEFHAS